MSLPVANMLGGVHVLVAVERLGGNWAGCVAGLVLVLLVKEQGLYLWC